MSSGGRICIYDNGPDVGLLGLSWLIGAHLFRLLGRFDAVYGVDSWEDALQVMAKHQVPITEVQFWMHGCPGAAFINHKPITGSHLFTGPLAEMVKAAAANVSSDAVLWFRTCASFNGSDGKYFAVKVSKAFSCKVAGHTYNIAAFHSGLHTLSETGVPTWDDSEGTDDNGNVQYSGPFKTNTVICLNPFIPKGW